MTSFALSVHPLSEVRRRLSETVARFRREGASAEPVVFGSQRKPEAVLLPYAAYEELVEYRRRRHALDVAEGSVRAEGLEPSAETIARAERWARGEISETDVYEETLRHYRRL
ncbi:hypothetical protein [Actinoallomurus sp. NPDC050550]|uniref:antitoxin VbhA family protein n=1 Tax=Actinoallomurus sp. NPDC050550 TaxID=3154937 RepID=UPI00340828D2